MFSKCWFSSSVDSVRNWSADESSSVCLNTIILLKKKLRKDSGGQKLDSLNRQDEPGVSGDVPSLQLIKKKCFQTSTSTGSVIVMKEAATVSSSNEDETFSVVTSAVYKWITLTVYWPKRFTSPFLKRVGEELLSWKSALIGFINQKQSAAENFSVSKPDKKIKNQKHEKVKTDLKMLPPHEVVEAFSSSFTMETQHSLMWFWVWTHTDPLIGFSEAAGGLNTELSLDLSSSLACDPDRTRSLMCPMKFFFMWRPFVRDIALTLEKQPSSDMIGWSVTSFYTQTSERLRTWRRTRL